MREKALTLLLLLTLVTSAERRIAAQETAAPALRPYADRDHVVYMLPQRRVPILIPRNLGYHGGPVIPSAKVVFIFWGPTFADPLSPDSSYAQTLQLYRNQLGTTPEFGVITQYSGIGLSNLASGSPDWFDTSTPPTNVTDSMVQSKVRRYLVTHPFNESAVYEVVLPAASYSSSGTTTSCSGPNEGYCAYHAWIQLSPTSAIKYSVQPYPSCSSCRVAGWSAVQNQEHFVVHETREAAMDPVGTGWFDLFLHEGDDKCAWKPTPFLGTGGFAYQYEWSNAAHGCVKSSP